VTIKRGTPLAQTGLLKPEDVRVAKALSISTLEEFVALLDGFPTQFADLFSNANIAAVLEDAPELMAFTFTSSDVQLARERRQKRATGALPPIQEEAKRIAELHLEDIELAPGKTSDRPEVFLSECLSPIRDQGDRGTCVAHAVVAMQECLEKRRSGADLDLSEQFLYWVCKMNDGDAQGFGTWQRVAVPLVVDVGICEESIWSYNGVKMAGNESQGPPPDRDKAYENAANHRATRGVVYPRTALDGLRVRLTSGDPVGISVPVYSNWGAFTVEQQGHIPMPPPRERSESGHAMLLVGYGFDEGFLGGGYFIVRNSWGTDWAPQSPFEPGYGTLPFSYVERYAWELFSLE
jgi:papain like protease